MKKATTVIALVVALGIGLVGSALAGLDFGLEVQDLLASKSNPLFGVGKPIGASCRASIDAATAGADPTALVTLAKGLSASVVTSADDAGAIIDMIALWPDDENPEWLIVCNEGDPDEPGVQRIEIATGEVQTILTGTSACDPIHRTPWGTIVFGEEEDDGHVYELMDPIGTTDVVLDRDTGVVTNDGGSGAENVVQRPALGFLAFEGIGILESGVVYYGDENRPLEGAPGGAYFKFVPESPWDGVSTIDELDQSPLASGGVYPEGSSTRPAHGSS
jgi:hypothetical protein